MKHFFYIVTLSLLALAQCPQAAVRTHNFGNGTLTFENDNKIGHTDDGMTYTCGKKGVFAEVSSVICLHLKYQNDSVVISPPLNKLSELTIWRNGASANDDNILIYVSRDKSAWTLLTGARVDYSNRSYVTATVPPNTYYVKLINSSSSKAVAIPQIRYTMLDCNCFSPSL